MKEKIRKSKKSFTIHQVFSIILIVVLMIYTICLILPILWGVFTSVKSFEDFRVDPVYPPLRHIWQWEWKNFAVIFENFFVRTADFREVGMLEQIWYTILYAGVGDCNVCALHNGVRYGAFQFQNEQSHLRNRAVCDDSPRRGFVSFGTELNAGVESV